MLGPPGSGRTCYTLGMYHAFKTSVGGFTVHTKDARLGRYFQEAWFGLRTARFPAPTDYALEHCEFEVRYGFDLFMEFDWTNYRGSVLTARREAGTKDHDYFNDLVRRADCLFLCISGEHLQQAIEGRTWEIQHDAAISRMLFLCMDAEPIPTVILVTKSDLAIRHRGARRSRGRRAKSVPSVVRSQTAHRDRSGLGQRR